MSYWSCAGRVPSVTLICSDLPPRSMPRVMVSPGLSELTLWTSSVRRGDRLAVQGGDHVASDGERLTLDGDRGLPPLMPALAAGPFGVTAPTIAP